MKDSRGFQSLFDSNITVFCRCMTWILHQAVFPDVNRFSLGCVIFDAQCMNRLVTKKTFDLHSGLMHMCHVKKHSCYFFLWLWSHTLNIWGRIDTGKCWNWRVWAFSFVSCQPLKNDCVSTAMPHVSRTKRFFDSHWPPNAALFIFFSNHSLIRHHFNFIGGMEGNTAVFLIVW